MTLYSGVLVMRVAMRSGESIHLGGGVAEAGEEFAGRHAAGDAGGKHRGAVTARETNHVAVVDAEGGGVGW